MKYGLQFVQAWGSSGGVENVSNFLLEAAVEAENAGWDGFFLWDHLYFTWAPVAVPDSWSILSAAAARTKQIKLGTNVTALPRRRPQVLAKQLVTVDQLSNGRAILGAGLGGGGQGDDAGEEFTSFGEASKYPVLGRMTDEALEVITALWSGEPVNHRGRFYTVNNVTFQPIPVQKPRIPIWIGALQSPALKRAARYDGWITVGPCPSVGDPGITFQQVAEKMNRIKKHRGNLESFDLVYSFEFPDADMDGFIHGAEDAGVTWMLDIISAMRFSGEEALEYIRGGPPA
jgi:alkanesulfonate monooxygenase SsuD/methylene tetrahydromethanopterin reductase-like flavin-dependent oxidoreductase (luciferase family)